MQSIKGGIKDSFNHFYWRRNKQKGIYEDISQVKQRNVGEASLTMTNLLRTLGAGGKTSKCLVPISWFK